jgi:mercuric ion transport protein
MSISAEPTAKKLVFAGLAGSVLAALCCFAPVLVPILSAIGLSAWLGWLDYVLLPAMAVFLGIAAWGVWRWRRAATCATTIGNKEGA